MRLKKERITKEYYLEKALANRGFKKSDRLPWGLSEVAFKNGDDTIFVLASEDSNTGKKEVRLRYNQGVDKDVIETYSSDVYTDVNDLDWDLIVDGFVRDINRRKELNRVLNKKNTESKKVTEGWVSDESHSLWYNLANSLAHDLNCDVWINDIGWMELSKDDEQLIQIYVRWNGGRGELIANKDAKEQVIGQCSTDRLPEASFIANHLVSKGLWEL